MSRLAGWPMRPSGSCRRPGTKQWASPKLLCMHIPDGGTLHMHAGPHTDLFIDPRGGKRVLNAPRQLQPVSGDFLLKARVTVEFRGTFDAGALLIEVDDETWGKLCFEYSPPQQPMIVSVVTRQLSDDCNSSVVSGNQVWLRVARLGQAVAFHASYDGETWVFVRHFALPMGGSVQVGFVAQAPTGDGCDVTFDSIQFEARTLADLRSGI
jgi:regulation of enolase protein 1 (concanavalin A-like superfamily)